MANPAAQAVAALQSGNLASLDSIGTQPTGTMVDSPSADSSQEGENGADEVSRQDSDVEKILNGEAKPGEETEETPETEAKPASSKESNVEVVEVDGKKYKVDFSDKEQVRKYARMAARMSKFQSERDQSKSQLAETQKQLTEYKSIMDQLQPHADDPAALLKIFSGGKIDLDKLVTQRIERERLMAEATPEERAQIELKEQLTKERQETARLKEMMNTHLKTATEKEKAAEMTGWKSKTEPVFHALSFDGKLGNAKVEAMLNGTLWREGITRLMDYPESHQLTHADIVKEFKAVRTALDTVAKTQAAAATKKISTDRKVKAKESAQLAAARGNSFSSLDQEVATKIRNGDLKSILANPGKYFSVFNKK